MGERTCTVEGCPNRRKRAGGLCSTHYRHAVRDGFVERYAKPCAVDGCDTPRAEEVPAAYAMCTKHYKRLLRTGTTDDPEPYPETCELFYCSAPYYALGLCQRHYKNQWQRDQTLWRTILREAGPPETCVCTLCGAEFLREHYQGPKAKYCPACKPAVVAGNKARWYEANAPELVTEYVCRYCGCQFCYIVPDGKPRTICAGCVGRMRVEITERWAKRHPEQHKRLRAVAHGVRRARIRGVDAERVDKYVVFERDGWRCHICGQAIDRDLKWPDLRSASLDHIIPLAIEPPQHTYANTAASHVACNFKKGARLLSELAG